MRFFQHIVNIMFHLYLFTYFSAQQGYELISLTNLGKMKQNKNVSEAKNYFCCSVKLPTLRFEKDVKFETKNF